MLAVDAPSKIVRLDEARSLSGIVKIHEWDIGESPLIVRVEQRGTLFWIEKRQMRRRALAVASAPLPKIAAAAPRRGVHIRARRQGEWRECDAGRADNQQHEVPPALRGLARTGGHPKGSQHRG